MIRVRKTDVTDLGVEAGISKSKQECTEDGNVDAGCVNGYDSVHVNPGYRYMHQHTDVMSQQLIYCYWFSKKC